MKKCCKCKIEKSKKEFTKDGKRKDGLDVHCKECKKNYRINNPQLEYHRNYHKQYLKTDHGKEIKRNNKLKVRHGITIEDYDSMFELQNGKCKICGSENPKGVGRFSVDHDHNSGRIRGLLCFECNTGLGKFNDSIVILAKAIEYLQGE